MQAPPTSPSTRAQTRLSGRYVRATSGSQSLERGLALLRAFKPGTSVLTNAELASRARLPRPTVSRLTRSLVESDFLVYDHAQRGYRLAPVCLSLGLNFRSACTELDLALPLMRETAEAFKVNVGLAALDGTEMVYLDSVRMGRTGIPRRVLPGTRLPLTRSALGCAYLAAVPAVERQALMNSLTDGHGTGDLHDLAAQVEHACRHVEAVGYCWTQWLPRIVSIATPIASGLGEHYALNISAAVGDTPDPAVIEAHGQALLTLKRRVSDAWARNSA